jgi:hypothetical protein
MIAFMGKGAGIHDQLSLIQTLSMLVSGKGGR